MSSSSNNNNNTGSSNNNNGGNPQTPSLSSDNIKREAGTSTLIGSTSDMVGSSMITTTTTVSSQPRHCYNVIEQSFSPDVHQFVYHPNHTYNIALLINDCISCQDLAISAISHPISTCQAVSLTILNSTTVTMMNTDTDPSGSIKLDDDAADNDHDHKDNEARQWLEMNSINPDTTRILYGHDGFQQVLNDSTIHAIYIFVPATLQQQYVIATLNSNKHVLLKDIVSTPSKDYSDQLSCAMEHTKFIQFSTMFVHHYHVQTFLNCVRMTFTFGTIIEIDAILTINIGQDLKALNVSLPLSKQQGCIRRLARFPVLITTLMLSQQQDQNNNDMKPISAQVMDSIIDEVSGEPISAHCEVLFTNHIKLKCYVVYSDAPTRQVLTVKSDMNRYATMTDFVLPHPDGLATYRIYDKIYNEYTNKYDIVRGECLDVPTGPSQNVAMWRNFHQLCHTVDTYGWKKQQPHNNDLTTTPPPTTTTTTTADSITTTPDTDMKIGIRSSHQTNNECSIREALLLTESAIQTKRILIALDESFYTDGTIIYFS